MKALLLGAAAALALGVPARAADGPSAAGAPSVSAPFTWTGLYVGASAGSAVLGEAGSAAAPPVTWPSGLAVVPGMPSVAGLSFESRPALRDRARDATAPLSIQAGYNHQFTPGSGFVVGIETDVTRMVSPPPH